MRKLAHGYAGSMTPAGARDGRQVVHEPHACEGALARALEFLGMRWNGVILATLIPGPLGFADLQASFIPLLIAAPLLIGLSAVLLRKQES